MANPASTQTTQRTKLRPLHSIHPLPCEGAVEATVKNENLELECSPATHCQTSLLCWGHQNQGQQINRNPPEFVVSD